MNTPCMIASVLACCLMIPCAVMAQDQPRSTVVGTLQTGVMAIGGETTGTVVRTLDGKTSYDLDIDRASPLRQRADELSGKVVAVTGRLEIRPGVEIRRRMIITPTTITAAQPGAMIGTISEQDGAFTLVREGTNQRYDLAPGELSPIADAARKLGKLRAVVVGALIDAKSPESLARIIVDTITPADQPVTVNGTLTRAPAPAVQYILGDGAMAITLDFALRDKPGDDMVGKLVTVKGRLHPAADHPSLLVESIKTN